MERILILGDPRDFHVGGHLRDAARDLALDAGVCDVRMAVGNWFTQRMAWHLLDHRYAKQSSYERRAIIEADTLGATEVIATGFSPIRAKTIRRLKANGARCVNFLTDDPWNPRMRSSRFLDALHEYDVLFTPRRSNVADLIQHGCRKVEYLPFAYNPHQHFPVDHSARQESLTDVLFIGGADADRAPIVHALLDSALKVTVFGGYWERFKRSGLNIAGYGSTAELRLATAEARVTLILVRRANRDGHVMRTFEAAAEKGCLVVEDTREHREIFGEDNLCVRYFSDERSMVVRTAELLNSPHDRNRLREAVYDRIVVNGHHAYSHRLQHLLDTKVRLGECTVEDTAPRSDKLERIS